MHYCEKERELYTPKIKSITKEYDTLAAAVAIDNGLRENHIPLKWVMVNAFTIPSLFFELKCVYDVQIIIAFPHRIV